MRGDEIRTASETLLSGGIILYPTDTIWGIGCDATNPGAVERIYRIKKRPDQKSMLVLMDSISMLARYVENVPEKAQEIIGKAGEIEEKTREVDKPAANPTTIIYPGARNLAPNLLAEDGSIGIRIPSDPFCLELIGLTGLPLVSTSANVSGNPAPRFFREIDNEIIQAVDYTVDHRREEATPASPSRVIKIDPDGKVTVLRP